MLILSRRKDQSIVIAGNICVRVLGLERNRVKIGISAPLGVSVIREELLVGEGENRATNRTNTRRKVPSEAAVSSGHLRAEGSKQGRRS